MNVIYAARNFQEKMFLLDIKYCTFNCNTCDKAFSQKDKLNIHLFTHENKFCQMEGFTEYNSIHEDENWQDKSNIVGIDDGKGSIKILLTIYEKDNIEGNVKGMERVYSYLFL